MLNNQYRDVINQMIILVFFDCYLSVTMNLVGYKLRYSVKKG